MFAITPRLTLRPGWPEDAAPLAEAIGHKRVVVNLARAPWPYARSDAAWFLEQSRMADQPNFLICERHGAHRLIGGIELLRDRDAWELGYWLTPDAWGRGYATEAGRAVLGMAPSLGIRRVAARHHADNPASGRVLRKLGFHTTGASRTFSRGRGGDVDSIELALTLGEESTDAMPMAA